MAQYAILDKYHKIFQRKYQQHVLVETSKAFVWIQSIRLAQYPLFALNIINAMFDFETLEVLAYFISDVLTLNKITIKLMLHYEKPKIMKWILLSSFHPSLALFPCLIAVKLSGKLYSAIMSTGRICPCQRPYKDSANSLNSVGKNLMSLPGRRQSSGKSIQTLWYFPHQFSIQVAWSTSLVEVL